MDPSLHHYNDSPVAPPTEIISDEYIDGAKAARNVFDMVLPSSKLRARFVPVEVLGKGQYGVVWRCEEAATGRQFACKRISRAACRGKAWANALREVEVMMALRGKGENLLSLEAAYADKDNLYLVMELAEGGDLLAHIQRQGRMGEDESRDVFASVVMGVKQCHDNNVIHRDLKPENILFCVDQSAAAAAKTTTETTTLATKASLAPAKFIPKIGDFGLSLILPRWQQVIGYAGSFPYEAPEVLANEPYDESADVFSLGVLLYAMLSGTWPLFQNNVRELEEPGDWRTPCWADVSEEAKNLIRWMLSPDPLMRPTVDRILRHPWFAPFWQGSNLWVAAAESNFDTAWVHSPPAQSPLSASPAASSFLDSPLRTDGTATGLDLTETVQSSGDGLAPSLHQMHRQGASVPPDAEAHGAQGSGNYWKGFEFSRGGDFPLLRKVVPACLNFQKPRGGRRAGSRVAPLRTRSMETIP
eukprot:TRINITY_DN4357_c0_g1_i1.p1 TRINITY_DN4357_c0_g1~~TRINITY_DN4357_c0_g1_i1.p1  ORF type:complete len:473 (-),score=-3.19 TRINITY_DN4357_c0_g1_i1:360-1778(-)